MYILLYTYLIVCPLTQFTKYTAKSSIVHSAAEFLKKKRKKVAYNKIKRHTESNVIHYKEFSNNYFRS